MYSPVVHFYTMWTSLLFYTPGTRLYCYVPYSGYGEKLTDSPMFISPHHGLFPCNRIAIIWLYYHTFTKDGPLRRVFWRNCFFLMHHASVKVLTLLIIFAPNQAESVPNGGGITLIPSEICAGRSSRSSFSSLSDKPGKHEDPPDKTTVLYQLSSPNTSEL